MDELPIETDVTSVNQWLEDDADFLLLDCRGLDEHAAVHLKSCTLIPMPELPDRVAELGDDRDRHIVVYCHVGGRSLMVAQWLRQQGFHRAQSMAGGIDAWSTEIDKSLPRY